MRTGEDQFITKGHEFYDSMITAVIGLPAVAVYELIRRYVWRSDEKGSRTVRAERAAGRLSSHVSQAKIAAMVGLSRGTVSSAVEKLRRIGWFYTVETKTADGGTAPLTYVLGDTSPTGMEVFSADGFLRQLHDVLAEAGELTTLERQKLTTAFVSEVERRFDEQMASGKMPSPQSLLHPPVQPLNTPTPTVEHPLSNDSTPSVHGLNTEEDNPEVDKIEEEKSEREERSPSASAPRRENLRKPPPRNGGERSLTRTPDPALEEGEAGSPRPKMETRAPGEPKATREPSGESARAAQMVRDHVVAGRGLEAIDHLKQQTLARRTASIEKLRKSEKAKANLDGSAPKPLNYVRAVQALEDVWMSEMSRHHPDTPIAPWDAQRRGQAGKLAESYGQDAVDAVRYMVRSWVAVSTKMLGKPGDVPTIGFLLRFADRIVPGAKVFMKHAAVVQEHADWWKANPTDMPPSDLEARYHAAKEELEKLGVLV